MKISIFEILASIAKTHGAIQRRRFKFVFRFSLANRKPKTRGTLEKYRGPNEFTDFEQFEVERAQGRKSRHATNSAKHPGTGITLRLTALRVMCDTSTGRHKAMKFAPARTPERFSAARTPERFSARNRSTASIFHEIFDFRNFGFHCKNPWCNSAPPFQIRFPV